MKKILISVFGLVFSIAAFSQIITRPNPGTLGVGYARVVPDSTLYYPTGCGVPSNTARVGLHTAKGEIVKMAAIYRDTCGHQTYSWDPALNSGAGGWDSVGKAGGAGGGSPTRLGANPTATTVPIKDTASGSTVVIPAATPTAAGATTANDYKFVLARTKIAVSAAELRTTAIAASSSAIYRLKVNNIVSDFIYDPTDISSADDSVMTIVNTFGERYKRAWAGEVNIDWWIDNPAASDMLPYFLKATKWLALMYNTNGQTPTLILGNRHYPLSSTWEIDNFYGGTYHFLSVRVTGAANYILGAGTNIDCNFKDAPGINFQQNKGSVLENVSMNGQFTPPWSYLSVITANETMNDNTCVHRKHAVYAAVTLDAIGDFGYGTGDDSGYYPLKSKYTSGFATGGSTGFQLLNSSISNFTVGFIASVNGHSQNAEETTIDHVRFSYTKYCIVNSQDQEKSCIAKNCHAWDSNLEFFNNTGEFGVGTPGNWTLDNVDVAGAMGMFINRPTGSYQAMYLNNIYAESLGAFGVFNGGNVGSTANNIDMSFATHYEGVPLPAFCISSSGVSFNGGHMRFYTGQKPYTPVTIFGNSKFTNIYFDEVPYTNAYTASTQGMPSFFNCAIGDNAVPFNQKIVANDGFGQILPAYGDYTIDNTSYEQYGVRESWNVKSPRTSITVFSDYGTFIRGSGTTYKAYVPQGEKYKFDSLGMVIFNDGADGNHIAGLITQLNVQTDSVQISYMPASAVTGSAVYIGCFHPINFPGTFLGDVTSGSATVTNVVMDYGYITNLAGQWIRAPGTATNSGPYLSQSDYQKVISVTGSSVTFSKALGYTKVAESFTNNSVKSINFIGNAYRTYNEPTGLPMLAGTIVKDDYTGQNLEVLVGGFNVANADARKYIAITKNTTNGYFYAPKIELGYGTDGREGNVEMYKGSMGVGKVIMDTSGTGDFAWRPLPTGSPIYPRDDFKSYDIPSLAGRHTSYGNAQWTYTYQQPGTVSDLGIVNGKATQVGTFTTGQGTYYKVPIPTRSVVVKAVVGNVGTAGGVGGGSFVYLNWTDPNNLVAINLITGQAVVANLGTYSTSLLAFSGASVAGDTMTAVLNGTTLSTYRNGTPIGSGTISTSGLDSLYSAIAVYNDPTASISFFGTYDLSGIPSDVTADNVKFTFRKPGTDSVFAKMANGSNVFQYRDSTGGVVTGLDTTVYQRQFNSTTSTAFNIDTVYFSSGSDERITVELDGLAGKVSGGTYTCKKRMTFSQIGGVYSSGTLISIVPDEYLPDASPLSTYTIRMTQGSGKIFITCTPEAATINGQIEYRVKRLKL